MVYSEVCNVTYVMSRMSRLSCVKCRVRKASGVSLKRASKMQLRGVDLRSVRHSSQKLWPVMDFLNFAICKSFVYVRGSSSKGNKDIWPKALFSLLIRGQNFAEKCSDTWFKDRVIHCIFNINPWWHGINIIFFAIKPCDSSDVANGLARDIHHCLRFWHSPLSQISRFRI